MERKLILSDIARYLPYGLHVCAREYYDAYPTYGTVNKVEIYYDEENTCIGERGKFCILLDSITPVLRPLSDLYRTIRHNGEEIVPIVELAKMAYPHIDCWRYDGYKKATSSICCEFFYMDESNRFGASIPSTNGIESPPNQYRLFDYMNSIFIDYHGLIDVGRAIDVNTLESNPYK